MTPITLEPKRRGFIRRIVGPTLLLFFFCASLVYGPEENRIKAILLVSSASALLFFADRLRKKSVITIDEEGVRQGKRLLKWGDFKVSPQRFFLSTRGIVIYRKPDVLISVFEKWPNYSEAIKLFQEKGLLPEGDLVYQEPGPLE